MSMSSCSGPLNTGQSEEVPVLELETFWTEEEEEDRGRREDCGEEMEGGCACKLCGEKEDARRSLERVRTYVQHAGSP